MAANVKSAILVPEIHREENSMRRCVIVAGAAIGNYEAVKAELRPDDFNIFCDSGLRHIKELGVEPHLIVGDFDSHENPNLSAETIVLPREKDDTDTFYAAKLAVERGFDEFLIVGAVGARLDHTLGNISILIMLHSLGKTAAIVDDYSKMLMVGKGPYYVKDCIYFSLLNVTGRAKGVTIKNAKYELSSAEILPQYQYGVSNELVGTEPAVVSVEDGELLLIMVRNE